MRNFITFYGAFGSSIVDFGGTFLKIQDTFISMYYVSLIPMNINICFFLWKKTS